MKISYKRNLIEMGNLMRYLSHYSSHPLFLEALDVIKAITSENVMIPIEKGSYSFRSNDKQGMRILGYNLLDREQKSEYFNLKYAAENIRIPIINTEYYVSDTEKLKISGQTKISREKDISSIAINNFEEYDEVLMVAYATTKDFFYKWANGIPLEEQEKIEDKKVKDCSVQELLLLANKKLRGKNET